MLRKRENRLRVDGHLGRCAGEAVAGEDLVVVDDDPVVDPDHGPVPDGVVVRLDGRMALRVVTDVHENLRRGRRHMELVQQGGCTRATLVDPDNLIAAAIRIADCIGSPLGDPGQQRLRRERLVDAGGWIETVSGDSTHIY